MSLVSDSVDTPETRDAWLAEVKLRWTTYEELHRTTTPYYFTMRPSAHDVHFARVASADITRLLTEITRQRIAIAAVIALGRDRLGRDVLKALEQI